MIPYWVLFLIFAMAAALSNDSRQRSFLGFCVGLILAIMIGLRFRVGGDWYSYGAIFQRLSSLNLVAALDVIEPAYALVNWGVAHAGLDIWFVNLICACIFTYGFLKFCWDQPNPMLAVLVGTPYLVIVVAMGYTRQGAALGLVMAALTFYCRGLIMRMTFFLVAAVMFHKSAIIMIPFIVLASSRRRVLTIIILGVIATLMYYLLISGSLNLLLTNYIEARYSSSGAGIRIAMNLVPASIYLLLWRRFPLDRDQRRLWMILSIGSWLALVLLITTPSSTAVDRVALYLIPLQLFVFSRVPVIFSGRENASAALKLAVIVYSAAIQFVWLNYAANSSEWLPYRSYLFS